MLEEYRRKLPHFQPISAMFFITFRLFGSIPMEVLEEIKNNSYSNSDKINFNTLKLNGNELFFDQMDSYLDKEINGPYHLSNPNIAKIVSDSILYRDGKDYKLVCLCIMSNHLHMIIYKLQKPLHVILKELKSYTGKEANKVLGFSRNQTLAVGAKSKRFWQEESFDRVVRNRIDLANKVDYVINNPVKAGLVDNWKECEWTYCNPKFTEL